MITVSDHGIGISPARLETSSSLSSNDESRSAAGLELAVVHDLLEEHGGTIVASSAAETLGSESLVTLPIRCELPAASSS